MGHRVESEAHQQAHGHSSGHTSFHGAFPPSPSHIVEKLVRLKNSDPELFTEAWNRLPDTVRENILSYLKKYPKLLEGEYPLLLLHRTGKLSKDEVEEIESRAPPAPEPRRAYLLETIQAREDIVEPVRKQDTSSRTASKPIVARIEKPAAQPSTALPTPRRVATYQNKASSSFSTPKGDEDSLLLAELRKISRQNKTQIGLMRRLVETSKGKTKTTRTFSFPKNK